MERHTLNSWHNSEQGVVSRVTAVAYYQPSQLLVRKPKKRSQRTLRLRHESRLPSGLTVNLETTNPCQGQQQLLFAQNESAREMN